LLSATGSAAWRADRIIASTRSRPQPRAHDPLAHLVVAIPGPLRVELLESDIDASGFDILAQFTLQGVILGLLLQQFLVNIGACSSSTGWPCLACLARHPVCSCTWAVPLRALRACRHRGAAATAADSRRRRPRVRHATDRVPPPLMSAVVIDGIEWPVEGAHVGDRAARASAAPVPPMASRVGAPRRSLRARRGPRGDGGT
jgi:hypothetical protein